MVARDELRYSVVRGDSLDESLARELASLFSSAYGTWSRKSPIRPGEPIKLGASYYLKNCKSKDYRIALCRDEGRLVAQAVYVEKKTSRGVCALVVQLLVASEFRRQGIATSLLHAAWGFSDYYAWGIVTSSPCTVEALEAATFRRCRAAAIAREARFLKKELLSSVPFLGGAEWQATKRSSVVNTRFFTDRRTKPVSRREVEGRIGCLAEGWEWLAFTFRSQPLDAIGAYAKLVESSGSFVSEAYRRMPQARQKWAARTREETSAILKWVSGIGKCAAVCDFGAGSGRHLAEFRRRGFEDVAGIDFAPTEAGAKNGVVPADCRSWRSNRRYDLILCLYDVIGSFSDEKSNLAIVKNIARHLKRGGFAAISVANFNYNGCRAIPQIGSTKTAALLKRVFELAPAETMAKSGEFFDRATALVDPKTRLFYHKEQFRRGAELPGEYLVIDRRYHAGELSAMLETCGLKVVRREFVRAGFTPLAETDGKEILFIVKRT